MRSTPRRAPPLAGRQAHRPRPRWPRCWTESTRPSRRTRAGTRRRVSARRPPKRRCSRGHASSPEPLLRVFEVELRVRHPARQLGPRAKTKLSIDASEMRLDGSYGCEQLGRDLAVCPTGRNESGYAALGARQLAVAPRPRARAAELVLSSSKPERRTQLRKNTFGRLELLCGTTALAQPAERLARHEQRAPPIERKADGLGGNDRLFGGVKRGLGLPTCEQEQRPAPKLGRHGPPVVGPPRGELGKDRVRFLQASERNERLDGLGHRFGEARVRWQPPVHRCRRIRQDLPGAARIA